MEELRATSDFRSIRLSWKLNVTPPIGFAVEYCELVTWGKDRCVTQIVNNSDIQLQTNLIEVGSPKLYEIVIGGLRIATNYSVDIQPLTTMDWPVTPFRGRSLNHNEIIVATKGCKYGSVKSTNATTDRQTDEHWGRERGQYRLK